MTPKLSHSAHERCRLHPEREGLVGNAWLNGNFISLLNKISCGA